MALSLEVIKNLQGFSIAKYSTWFYYKPDHLLFDVGEGISVSMRNMIYGINYVFISHGHGDHIAGLPGLLRSRASSMGDKARPMVVYYPKGDHNMVSLQNYIQNTVEKLPFDLSWKEMEAGEYIALSGNRSLQSFPSSHTNSNTLGYKIVEHRTRLKPQYRDLSRQEILEVMKKQGKEEMSETYQHILLAYSGDSMPLDGKYIQNAEVLLHDATFLETEDRDEDTHATVDEAIQTAQLANVSVLGLFHISARYKYQQVLEKIQTSIKNHHVSFPVFYIFSNLNRISFKQANG